MLYYPDDWIRQALNRHIKLDAALKLLEKSAEVHYPDEYSPQTFEIETPEEYAERMKKLLQSSEIKIPNDDWWREQN